MAVINILAKSDGLIKWDDLLNRYDNLKLSHIEIFPIPQQLGFDQDSIGINVCKGYSNKQTVISELKLAIDFFISYNLKVIELYDGVEVLQTKIADIADKLLPAAP